MSSSPPRARASGSSRPSWGSRRRWAGRSGSQSARVPRGRRSSSTRASSSTRRRSSAGTSSTGSGPTRRSRRRRMPSPRASRPVRRARTQPPRRSSRRPSSTVHGRPTPSFPSCQARCSTPKISGAPCAASSPRDRARRPTAAVEPPAATAAMRTGIATVCLSGTLEEKLRAAAAAGFDGVELFEADPLGSHLSPADVGGLAAELGLTIALSQPFRDFEAVPLAQLERNLRRAEAKFDVMAQIGATTMLVCSNVSEAAIDDDALAAAQLRALAGRAAARGIRIAYEALAGGRHVSEYDHAWRIVEAGGHPALGTCLDSFHILSRGTSLDTIAEIPAEKLFFVQLADAPHLV